MQAENDGRNDFDFLVGNFIMRHRRLKERLKGCTEWEDFDRSSTGKKNINGLGHTDEVVINRSTGYNYGYTVRLFNVNSRQWSIYWSAGASNVLDTPMIGGFKNGIGEFYSQEVFERPAHLLPLYLVEDHRKLRAVGTGVFHQWRKDLGNQLDEYLRTG